MKKWVGYVIIIVPIIYVAFKWQVWGDGVGMFILAMIALLNCTIWSDLNNKKNEQNGQKNT